MNHTKELILRAHEGDKEARDRLVMENMGLVYSVSRRFIGRGCELEDINQIGTIGLIKAIDKFDDSFDVRFSTYAVPMIAGEIKRFLRDDGMLKVSRSIKENGYRIKRASDELVSKNGREATVEELAAATELSVEDVVMALDAGTDVESIYRTVYQGDGSEIFLVDKITSADNVSSSEGSLPQQEKMLDMIMLRQLLEELDETERKLISLRYFKEMTQSAVANELGISQVQVSRLEKKILQKLRKNIF
jgi:RNA polymerase sporulation-specific sigma factor